MVFSIAPRDVLGAANMRTTPPHRRPSPLHNNPTTGSPDSR